jgi:hypothetical protein
MSSDAQRWGFVMLTDLYITRFMETLNKSLNIQYKSELKLLIKLGHTFLVLLKALDVSSSLMEASP